MKQTKTLLTLTIIIWGIFAATVCFAGNIDNMLKKAIERGRTSWGSYVMNKKDGRSLKAINLVPYLSENNFMLIDVKLNVFGYVTQAEFIEKDNYDLAVFYELFDKRIDISQLKSEGDFFAMDNDQKIDGRILHARWTGDVVDGFIHGQGFACTKIGRTVFCIEGTYEYGIPVSEITIKSFVADAKSFDLGVVIAEKIETICYNRPDLENLTGVIDKYNQRQKEYIKNYALSKGARLDAERCLNNLKESLKYGNTPFLSKEITAKYNWVEYIYFKEDEEAATNRSNMELFAKAGVDEAIEALLYIDVFDALHLTCLKDNRDKAMRSLSSSLEVEFFKRSNYWNVLENAEKTLVILKELSPDFLGELTLIEDKIVDWNRIIFPYRDKAIKAASDAREKAAKAFWNSVLDNLTSNSYSYSSSSSSTSERSSVPIDRNKILKMVSKVSEWKKGDFDVWENRKITFSDKIVVYILYDPDKNIAQYGYDAGGLRGVKRWYKTYEDALVAAYLWYAEDIVSYEGRGEGLWD